MLWAGAFAATGLLAVSALMAHTLYVQATVPSAFDTLRAERVRRGFPAPMETDAQLRVKYPNLYDERTERIMDGFYRLALPSLVAMVCWSLMILSIDDGTRVFDALGTDLPVTIFGALGFVFLLVIVGLMVASLHKLKHVRTSPVVVSF